MFNFKKVSICSLLFLTISFSFALTSAKELTQKYLELAVSELENNQYDKALEDVNAALKLNENDGIPANVCLVAESVYGKILDQMKDSGDFTYLNEIETYLRHYPAVADVRTKAKIDEMKALRLELSDQKNHSQELRIVNTMVISVLTICFILVMIFVLIVIVIRSAASHHKSQVEQFEETLKLVAGMQQTNNQILLGSVTNLTQIGGLRSAGSSRWAVDALPAPELNDSEKEELKQLAITCEDLGAKIDMVSKRKNNSKNVSEMVYKLAVALGCNQNTAMAYFCAAMVYDAGLLAVPEEMLSAESLTEQEKEVIHDHVNKTEEFFEFVPDSYRKIFEDAARFHHENEDGSGYPDGITGEHIPQVAKLIHVVESYSSLVSRRNYKTIMDKESAVEELFKKPDIYDAAVVKALDSIV